MITTPYGSIDADESDFITGELVVTLDGIEVEVVSLVPFTVQVAPEEVEDWGE